MDRNEFISILRMTLSEELDGQTVEEHVQYYYNYISDEIAKGKREEEVMELLGDPRLIARTILDAAGAQGYSGGARTYTEYGDREESQRGFHARENEEGGMDIHYGRLNLNTWFGKFVVIAIIVLVMTLIFTVVGGILSFLLPVLIPVLLIIFVIRMLTGRR